MSLKIIVCTLGLLVSANISAAQESFEEKYAKMISDDVADNSIQLALSKIQSAKCDGDKLCAPATPAEVAKPPLATNDARVAMVTAIKSALAQWCGLNGLRSFLPMLAALDKARGMNDRQRQLVALIHADFMGRQLAFYKNGGECPPEVRQQLDAQLPKM